MPKNVFEFVVKGPPYTANKDESKPKTDWKQAVGIAAYDQWIADGHSPDALPIKAAIEVYVTTYCGSVIYDVDNVLKWTLDGLSQKQRPALSNSKQREIDGKYQSLYEDDILIHKVTSERVILADPLESPPTLVADAVGKFDEFLHIVLIWED